MKRVAILISGTGSNMEVLVKAMQGDFPARPVLVISDEMEAAGLAKARALGVPTYALRRSDFPDRATFEAEIHRALAAARADIVCLAGFMRVLSGDLVARWQGRMLNIHPSLLPRYPGLDTHARVLAAGDARHGCTVHEVTAELDAGPIRGQARLDVAEDDTAESLARRVQGLEHRLYPQVLRQVAQGRAEPVVIEG